MSILNKTLDKIACLLDMSILNKTLGKIACLLAMSILVMVSFMYLPGRAVMLHVQ